MNYKKCGNEYAVRLSVGDEIHSALAELCEKEDIAFARISGLGAVDTATLGFYDKREKKYHTTTFEGPMELVSLIGNATRKDGKPYLHLHAAFSGRDCNLIGGHLNSAVIGVTAEIFVSVVDGVMGRRTQEETGINLFDI
ncbi:MAG: DNA-binding protein [Clostridia bacterium]|nr:DNA-binding protein [Clostridia bacterium]